MQDDILKIKDDEYLRNRFIEKYKPFIAKYASSLCQKYLQYGENEELSIALLAFNESIDRFNGEGVFFEYSKLVIKSRLYDYFQSQSYQESKHTSLDEEKGNFYLNLTSQDAYQEKLRQSYLKEEIELLKKTLNIYQIDILDLYQYRPKHLLTRKHIHNMIKEILLHDDIVAQIIDQGRLPTKKILNVYKTTEKKIEPYRKYILTIIIICSGQFELLQEYMPSEVIIK